jgi:hypothetical protein
MIHRVGIATFLISLSLPAVAMAQTAYGKQVIGRWTASDRCTRAAQKAFPDYTADAMAKRDDALKRCLANQSLPPRAAELPESAPKP